MSYSFSSLHPSFHPSLHPSFHPFHFLSIKLILFFFFPPAFLLPESLTIPVVPSSILITCIYVLCVSSSSSGVRKGRKNVKEGMKKKRKECENGEREIKVESDRVRKRKIAVHSIHVYIFFLLSFSSRLFIFVTILLIPLLDWKNDHDEWFFISFSFLSILPYLHFSFFSPFHVSLSFMDNIMDFLWIHVDSNGNGLLPHKYYHHHHHHHHELNSFSNVSFMKLTK